MRESPIPIVITLATVPIIIMNLVGGVVSAIWLLILGQWQYLLWGFGIMFFGSFILSLFLLLTMVFALPAAKLYERKKTGIASVLSFFGLATTLAVISVWCISIFNLYLGWATETTVIPLVIFSYGIATGELSYMASKEKENEGTMATLFAAQLAFIVMLVVFIITRDYSVSVWAFAMIMIFALVVESFFVTALMTANSNSETVAATEPLLELGIFCSSCGEKDSHGGSFCVSCGSKLTNN